MGYRQDDNYVKMQMEGMLSHLWTLGEIDETVLIELAEEYYALFEDIGKELL